MNNKVLVALGFLVFIKPTTADGYCLRNNGGGGAIPRQGVDENQRYQQ